MENDVECATMSGISKWLFDNGGYGVIAALFGSCGGASTSLSICIGALLVIPLHPPRHDAPHYCHLSVIIIKCSIFSVASVIAGDYICLPPTALTSGPR